MDPAATASLYGPLLDGAGVWLIALLTLAVFSFLYRDNPVYKLTEHIYVGTAAGYYFYQAFRGTIYPNLVEHIWRHYSEGGGKDLLLSPYWRFGALVLGVMILSRLVPKAAWISRWPTALIMGSFAGLNIVGLTKANLADQVAASFLPLYMRGTPDKPWFWILQPSASSPSAFNHLVLTLGVIAVLTYFFFSTRREGPLAKFSLVGIAFVMVTFGATYGSIVLARVSLLIGRMYALKDANRADLGYPTLTAAALIVFAIALWRIRFMKPDGEPTPKEGA
jgi:hypothetical protein